MQRGCKVAAAGEHIGKQWILVENTGGLKYGDYDLSRVIQQSSQNWKWPLDAEAGYVIRIGEREGQRQVVDKLNHGMREYEKMFNSRPRLVILLKPGKEKEDYVTIKKWCWKNQIPSQAITKGVLSKYAQNAFWKVGVQIVAKLGNEGGKANCNRIPWELSQAPYAMSKKMVVAIGISLYATKGARQGFAIVGTRDRGCTQATSHFGVADVPSGKVMHNFEKEFNVFLKQLRNSLGGKIPMGMMIYRLGVPETEEKVLLEEELGAIKRCLAADIGEVSFNESKSELLIRYAELPQEPGRRFEVQFSYYDKSAPVTPGQIVVTESGQPKLYVVEATSTVVDQEDLDNPAAVHTEIRVPLPENIYPEILSKTFKVIEEDTKVVHVVPWRCRVTFLNVTKGNSNNLRFYKNSHDSNTNMVSNMDAGTIIDSGLRRVVDGKLCNEFWLMASNPSLGTPSPSHYRVLYNGLDWEDEWIQVSTLKLCNMYYNWTGVIRVPHVVKLADKLSEQVANVYGDDSIMVGSDESVDFLLGQNPLKNTMFPL